jgi:hypothetical protein
MQYGVTNNSDIDAYVTAVLTRNLAAIRGESQLIDKKVPDRNFRDAVEIPVESQANCACHANREICP